MSRDVATTETDWRVPEAAELTDGPLGLDEVLGRFPTLRQSLLSNWDDCHLSTLFETRYAKGWSTVPQASGTIFHRFAAECLRHMQQHDSEHIPVGAALGILEWALDQNDVDPREIVTLPLREIPLLEMAARKFARDNSFTIRNLMGVERRYTQTLRYQNHDGIWVERQLTGQLDALIARPPDEAVVLDWKRTWMLPPEQHEDSNKLGVSLHGYFQQLFYAWLVMKEYESVQAVTLSEFYVFRTKARKARKTRADLPWIEEKLGRLCMSLDRAIAHGAPEKLDMLTVENHGYFKPAPGAHCFFCAAPQLCPIPDEAFTPKTVRSLEDAEKMAAARQVGKAIVKKTEEPLRSAADVYGPIPLKSAKGKRVLGHRQVKVGATGKPGGTRFEEYTPEKALNEADQAAFMPSEETEGLAAALRRAAARKKAEADG